MNRKGPVAAMNDSDEADYTLLTTAGATLDISLDGLVDGLPEILVLGNREGMLSLANVLLWLRAHDWRRELLSVTALPFVQRQGDIALSLRVLAEDPAGDYGSLHLMDKGCQYEWRIPEDDLTRLALTVHRLACVPEHGYDCVPITQETEARVRLELVSNRGGH
jgi:hypothetical protein